MTETINPLKHWTRRVMFQAGAKFISDFGQNLDITEVSGNLWQSILTPPFKSYRSTWFPQHDICQVPVPGPKSDIVILEQVLEHVVFPDLAIRNARASLKEGGALFVATPFLIKVHDSPVDLWRWTELGLRALISNNGFEHRKIDTGSWGNRACVMANFDQWTHYDPSVHSLENEREFPVMVWAFCRT